MSAPPRLAVAPSAPPCFHPVVPVNAPLRCTASPGLLAADANVPMSSAAWRRMLRAQGVVLADHLSDRGCREPCSPPPHRCIQEAWQRGQGRAADRDRSRTGRRYRALSEGWPPRSSQTSSIAAAPDDASAPPPYIRRVFAGAPFRPKSVPGQVLRIRRSVHFSLVCAPSAPQERAVPTWCERHLTSPRRSVQLRSDREDP